MNDYKHFFFLGMGKKIRQCVIDLGAFVSAVIKKKEGVAKALPRKKQISCDVSNWEYTKL